MSNRSTPSLQTSFPSLWHSTLHHHPNIPSDLTFDRMVPPFEAPPPPFLKAGAGFYSLLPFTFTVHAFALFCSLVWMLLLQMLLRVAENACVWQSISRSLSFHLRGREAGMVLRALVLMHLLNGGVRDFISAACV